MVKISSDVKMINKLPKKEEKVDAIVRRHARGISKEWIRSGEFGPRLHRGY